MSEINKHLSLHYKSNRTGSQISYRVIIDEEANDGTKELITTGEHGDIDLSKMKNAIREILGETIADGYDVYLLLTDLKDYSSQKFFLSKGLNCFFIQRTEDDDISVKMEYYSEECAQNAQTGGNALTAGYIEQCLKKENVTSQVGAMLKQYKRVLSFICYTEAENEEYEGKLDALQAKIAAQDDCEGYIDEVNALINEMKDMIGKDKERVHSYQITK